MMSAPASSHKRYVYSKEFLLRRKEATIAKNWPRHLSRQHINDAGLWDPVSYSKQLAKEEKLKRAKRQTGVLNPVYQRKRTRDVRDSYQSSWLNNGYSGYPTRNCSNPYYVRSEIEVYYDTYDDFASFYEYLPADEEYMYVSAQSAGRKRSSRPRRHGRPNKTSNIGTSTFPVASERSEPEWFTCGPTSHVETINLEGLPSKSESSKKVSSVGEAAVRMEVNGVTSITNSDKENDHRRRSKSAATAENQQADQIRRDTVGKQLLQLIQNGPQNNMVEYPPNLPPEVKDASTSAELETALKGLLFKEKENSRQKSDELFARLKAKSHPRHLRVGFYKKCMLNGQVKTVAELEGHADTSPEKSGNNREAKAQNLKSPSSVKGNSNNESGDQSAFYRLLGMIKANGNLEELPSAKFRVSTAAAAAAPAPKPMMTSVTSLIAGETGRPSAPSLNISSAPQGRSDHGDGDNTNNNSIKEASNAAASAAAAAAVVASSARPFAGGRPPMPLPQTGLFRGASNAVAAAAAVAAGINPMLPQTHAHVPAHLLSSHMPPHVLSAAAHQLFSQHSQQQQSTLSSQQHAQLAALAARYASGGVTPTPYIPPQWFYLAVAQQHAQAQQQQQQQSHQQQQAQSQAGASLPNIVGKAASAAAVLQQANSTQQSNAKAAEVCIKQNNTSQSSSTPAKLKLSNGMQTIGDTQGNAMKDGKKTLSESDIPESTAKSEEKRVQHSAHSTPGRGALRVDKGCGIETKKREKVASDSEADLSANAKENSVATSAPSTRATMHSKSTQSETTPVSSATGSGFTLVPPQRIAPPMQSSMIAVNNLFRLPQGYSPSLPPSMRLHQGSSSASSENGMESNGGLSRWFGAEVIGSHRLVGMPPLPNSQDASSGIKTVEEIEKR